MAKLSTKAEIRSKAAELAQLSPVIPVPIINIVDRYGVTVLEHNLNDNDSGLLVIKNQRPIIVVNRQHHPHRQHFTLAHELGHLLLHFDRSEDMFHRDQRSSQGTNRFEVQANNFAAQLLMPEYALLEHFSGQTFDVFDPRYSRKVMNLAKTFEVSQQAMSLRLQQLGLLI